MVVSPANESDVMKSDGNYVVLSNDVVIPSVSAGTSSGGIFESGLTTRRRPSLDQLPEVKQLQSA